MASAEPRAAWDAPIHLGTRLCWFDGERNATIPVLSVVPIHTDGRGVDGGWNALLPTENHAEVYLLWDPDFLVDEPPCSLWLYVQHPEYGYLVDARIGRTDFPEVAYWIEYAPWCDGPTCEGWCAWCGLGDHQWWEYVTGGPQHVLDRLKWIGSLPLRAVTEGQEDQQ